MASLTKIWPSLVMASDGLGSSCHTPLCGGNSWTSFSWSVMSHPRVASGAGELTDGLGGVSTCRISDAGELTDGDGLILDGGDGVDGGGPGGGLSITWRGDGHCWLLLSSLGLGGGGHPQVVMAAPRTGEAT